MVAIEKQVLVYLWYSGNLGTIRSISDRYNNNMNKYNKYFYTTHYVSVSIH